MYYSVRRRPAPRSTRGCAGAWLAAERAGGYDPAPARPAGVGTAGPGGSAAQAPQAAVGTAGPDAAAGSASLAGAGTLEDALAGLEAALDALAGVELAGEDDRALLDAAVGLQRLANRHAAGQLRVLGEVERRQAYGHDGAVTAASWYRGRTRLDHAEAARLVQAARRLRALPGLAAALDDGAVSLAHVTAVTAAAVPRRRPAIAAAEPTLVALARAGTPRDLRVALRRIADAVDPDGSDAAPLGAHGPDERREFHLTPSIDGLWNARGLLDPLAGEALATALDALDRPDPPDTPARLRRSPAQRRADALGALARRVLDHAHTPTVHGNKPHILAVVDLATLAGDDAGAARAPRLRHTGPIPPALARQLARQAKLTAVLTMGPWRVVNVGRTSRTLPPWLRAVLELVHGHCRGPDCDRPVAWTQAHHLTAWADHGDTDLNATVPLCQAHHDLVTSGRWHLAYDPDSGTCTWTGPAGQTIHTRAPPT